jgi:hypothetical protein
LPDVWQQHAKGQQFSIGLVWLVLVLVLDACVSLRGSSRVLAVVGLHLGLPLGPPDWTTGRSWLLRLGCYKLTRPKEHAADWVWFIDHSCQTGPDKCLVVLGLRLRDLPPPGECVCLEDLEPLEVLPVRSSTKEEVARQLQAVAVKTGVPRAIVRDDGGDLRGGVELFRGEHPQTADLYDIKHKTACLLKHLLGADNRWQAFRRLAGQTKCQVQQTEVAFLAPPFQRPKARYMSVGELLRWGEATLRLLDDKPAKVMEQVSAERLEAKLGWLRDYRAALLEWSEWLAVTSVAEEFVRRDGLYEGAADDLEECFPKKLAKASARKLRDELRTHVAGQAAQARPGERLPGSTEALESCFGKLKALEHEQSRSGFTGLLLGVGALVSRTTAQVVETALERCPMKKVWHWFKTKLGQTVQAQRRNAYAPDPAQ